MRLTSLSESTGSNIDALRRILKTLEPNIDIFVSTARIPFVGNDWREAIHQYAQERFEDEGAAAVRQYIDNMYLVIRIEDDSIIKLFERIGYPLYQTTSAQASSFHDEDEFAGGTQMLIVMRDNIWYGDKRITWWSKDGIDLLRSMWQEVWHAAMRTGRQEGS